jgi:ABC-type dipeptide/oligopeptide/nickel transport system permease component
LRFLATQGANANFSEVRAYIMVTENGTRSEACMKWKLAVVMALVVGICARFVLLRMMPGLPEIAMISAGAAAAAAAVVVVLRHRKHLESDDRPSYNQ